MEAGRVRAPRHFHTAPVEGGGDEFHSFPPSSFPGRRRASIPHLPRLADLTLPLRSLTTVLATRLRARSDERAGVSLTRVAGLALTSCFGETLSSTQIRRLARRCVEARAVRDLDHRDLAGGGRAHRVIHDAPLEALRQSGQGAVVAAIHLGPYCYVVCELLARGFHVVAIADDDAIDRERSLWEGAASKQPGRLELIRVLSPQSLLRAMRALSTGSIVIVYIDGGTGVGGPRAGGPHQIELTLGAMPVRLRTGAAYLAQRAAVPTLLSVAYRDAWGRRVVEFSDALPPPTRDEPESAETMVRAFAPWLERRILAHPEQWVGWLLPVLAWASTGVAPTATREALERTRERVRALLADSSGAARLAADPVRVGAVERGDDRVLVDGARRLILAATPLAVDVLRAAQRRTRLADLPRRVGGSRDALELEVTRMVLSGLATIEEPGRA